jgi:hypothetical protein
MWVNERNRFKEKGLIFLALNPGWANTDLAGEGSGVYVSLPLNLSCGGCDFRVADDMLNRRLFNLKSRLDSVLAL